MHFSFTTIAGFATLLIPSLVTSTPLRPSSTLTRRAIRGFEYVACHKEALYQRALSSKSYFDDFMTLEKCAAVCSSFEYFGVEYGVSG